MADTDLNDALQTIASLEAKLADSEKKKSDLTKTLDHYKALVKSKELKDANTDYKDRVFRFLFGHPDHKQWTLSLYNALNGTHYTDPKEIEFTTIDDVLYLKMKNDVSFLIQFVMNLYEHQGTFNPNMPLRFFLYGGRIYEKHILFQPKFNPYSDRIQRIPTPVCTCFYNGTEDMPEDQILRLSDAYEGKGDIEVTVRMLNINSGKNQALMEACAPLKEYAWLVAGIRRHQAQNKQDLDSAVDAAFDEMPDSFAIKSDLLKNRAEVKNMFLTEYDEEKIMRLQREEGEEKRATRIAEKLLRQGLMPISSIAELTELPVETIRNLAEIVARQAKSAEPATSQAVSYA